jgi:hypothetical protein
MQPVFILEIHHVIANMKSLSEPIARRANAEDKVSGRFLGRPVQMSGAKGHPAASRH